MRDDGLQPLVRFQRSEAQLQDEAVDLVHYQAQLDLQQCIGCAIQGSW